MDNKINNLINSADIYFYLNNAYTVGFLKLCELLPKIKQEGMSSTSNKGRSSQFPQVGNNITQSNNNVKLPT